MAQPSKYSAEEIQVLEGLDPVRKRPAMYIGGTGKDGYHHLLWEIVDNSIDEVINKHASKVEVTLHKGGKSATVEDNGRGIPVDTVQKLKKSALEVVFTKLHGGVEIVLRDEPQTPPAIHSFVHDKGIAEYLPKLVSERGKSAIPPAGGVFYMEKQDRDLQLGLELALQWTEATDDLIKTYVNS